MYLLIKPPNIRNPLPDTKKIMMAIIRTPFIVSTSIIEDVFTPPFLCRGGYPNALWGFLAVSLGDNLNLEVQ